MMDRHGAKAVFFGRWILGLRVWASWLAGASRMPWPRFVAWNAAGGISWATTVGLIIYFVGRAASQALQTAGFVGLGLFVLAVIVGYLVVRRRSGHAGPGRDAAGVSDPPDAASSRASPSSGET